jgi:regulator of protease activity HflC (stomatin/prohibitin superfamily)
MYWILATTLLVFIALGFRKVQNTDRGLILRLNRPVRVVGPGYIFLIPFLEKLRAVSIEPLSLSLPIQSAITRDEIPIQLQASLDAEVRQPELALKVARDWRISLVSKLQLLKKDKLEELDFDNLDSAFPEWIQSIRADMQQFAMALGVDITSLRISNLSPRTRPE